MNRLMQFFTYAHLPNGLQPMSKPVCDVATYYDAMLVESPEKTAGLRKLLEAKDCFVRASLEQPAKPESVGYGAHNYTAPRVNG